MTWSVIRRLLAADGGFGCDEPRSGRGTRPRARLAFRLRSRCRAAHDELVALAAHAVRTAAHRIPDRSLPGRSAPGTRPQTDAQPARGPRLSPGRVLAARDGLEVDAPEERDPASIRELPRDVHHRDRAALHRSCCGPRSSRTGRGSTRPRLSANSRRGFNARSSTSRGTVSRRPCSRTWRGAGLSKS